MWGKNPQGTSTLETRILQKLTLKEWMRKLVSTEDNLVVDIPRREHHTNRICATVNSPKSRRLPLKLRGGIVVGRRILHRSVGLCTGDGPDAC